MNEIYAALLEEAVSKGKKYFILDGSFKEQREFINDANRLKAIFCTRRAAKSYTCGLYLVKTCLENPGVNCLFIGLTRLEAKGIIWKDILKDIDQKHGLDIAFNGTELTATFPNGSVIWVTGVDADADEMKKLLGKKYKLCVLDEASMYSIDQRMLIYGILKPATTDQRGTICMAGTASNVTDGLFFDITTGKEAGWKLFQWTAEDNPYVAEQWREEIEDIKKNRPKFMETTLFKQWYLNQWVIDEDALVYKFNPIRDCVPNLPMGLPSWNYVLGLDLAHSPDSTAFVVGAYHALSPTLYIVYAYKEIGMDLTSVAEKVRSLEVAFPFEVKVVDGANKQAVAELNNRHGTNLLPADKTGKVDFITIMNDDFIQGHIKLLPQTKDLQAEYQKLIWITDASGKVKEPKKENPNIHQDLADAALYMWRYCYSYLFKDAIPFKDMSKIENWEPVHIKKLEDQVKQAQNPHGLDAEWNEVWQEDWDNQDFM